MKYQIHIILFESGEDGCDIVAEEEVVGCKDEYNDKEEALEDFNRMKKY